MVISIWSFDFVEVRNLADGLLQFLLQFRHIVFGDGKGLGNAHFREADLRGGSGTTNTLQRAEKLSASEI
jgi:hypothetical protein